MAMHAMLRGRGAGATVAEVEEVLAASKPSRFETDGAGRTPAHTAVACGCPPAVLLRLLDAFPEGARARDARGRTPLGTLGALGGQSRRDLLEPLLRHHPGGLEDGDDAAQLPLHLACAAAARQAQEEVAVAARALVAELARAHPGGVSAKDAAGRYPIDLCMAVTELHAPLLLQVGGGQPPRVLHSAAMARSTEAVRQAVAKWPDAAGEVDAAGCLPLDVALSSAPGEWGVILLLVEAHREGANNRRLLHAALGQGDARAVEGLCGLGGGVAVELCREADAGGRTPYAAALADGAPFAALLALLQAWPDAAAGALTLHEMVDGAAPLTHIEALLDAHPPLALEVDPGGMTPLHRAVRESARAGITCGAAARAAEEARGALSTARAEARSADSAAEAAQGAKRAADAALAAAEAGAAEAKRACIDGGGHPDYERDYRTKLAATEDLAESASLAGAAAVSAEALLERQRTKVESASALADAALALHNMTSRAAEDSGGLTRSLLQRATAAAGMVDYRGWSPLHVAAAEGASVDVVELLLEADTTAALVADAAGRLPADLALSRGVDAPVADPAVVGAIIRHCPARQLHAAVMTGVAAEEIELAGPGSEDERDADGRTPLDLALSLRRPPAVVFALVRRLTAGGSGSLSIIAPALEAALSLGAQPEVVEALVKANPDAAVGLRVLHRSVALPHCAAGHVLALAAAAPPGVLAREEDGAGRLPLEAAVEEGASWEVQMALLEQHPGAAARLLSSTGRGVVQRVLGGSGGAQGPPPVDPQADGELLVRLREVLRAYPHGALEADPRTRLRPLHAEVARGAAARVGVVECLLEACPKAAGLADGGGRSPLDVALASGAGAAVLMLLLPGSPAGVGLGPVLTRLVREQRPAGEVEAALGWAGAGAGEGAGAERQVGEALHLAVESRAGVEVVRALLGGSPGAAAHADMRGRLPLHVAAQVGAAPGTVDALLEAYPEGAGAVDGGGKLPSDYGLCCTPRSPVLLQALLKHDPRRAVHAAVVTGVAAGTIAEMVSARPQGAAEEDAAGMLPLDYALAEGRETEVIAALLKAHPRGGDGRGILEEAVGGGRSAEDAVSLIDAWPQGTGGADSGRPTIDTVLSLGEGGADEEDSEGSAVRARPLSGAPHHVDAEVILALARAAPGACQGKLLLHKLMRRKGHPSGDLLRILAAVPELAAETDREGRRPLHLSASEPPPQPAPVGGKGAAPTAPAAAAAADAAKQALLEALVSADPSGCEAEDSRGAVPAKAALSLYLSLATSTWESGRDAAAPLLGGALEHLAYLLSATETTCLERCCPGVVHQVLKAGGTSPTGLATLLRAYPRGGLELARPGGWSTLHVALRCRVEPPVLDVLLAIPGAAAVRAGNALRQLPLHYALAHGPASGEAKGDGVDENSEPAHAEAVMALVAAYPGALGEEDGEGRLPLEVAAATRASPFVLEVLARGTRPRPLHSALLMERPLQAVEEAIRACPDASYEIGPNGRTALHVAVARGAPREIVAAILAANPQAASCQDSSGAMPLHLAVAGGAPLGLVADLIYSHPEALKSVDGAGRLPRAMRPRHAAGEVALRLMLEAPVLPRNAVPPELANGERWLPAHLGVASGVPPEALADLLRAHPGAASRADFGRGGGPSSSLPPLPADLALARGRLGLGAMGVLLQACPRRAAHAALLEFAGLPRGAIGSRLRLLVEKDELQRLLWSLSLAGQGAAQERDSRGRLPLHVAAECGAGAPAVEVLLHRHPAGVSEADGRGRLPLDLALEAGAGPEVLGALVEADPSGLLALHAAVRAGAPVDDVRALARAQPAGLLALDRAGRTPLAAAEAGGAPRDVVEALVRVSAAPLKGALRSSVLLDSLWAGDGAESILSLVEAQPSLAALPDPAQRLPLEVAVMSGAAVEVLAGLLKANPKGALGLGVLHRAARERPAAELAALAASFPAGTAERDGRGRLPLHVASSLRRGTEEAVQALVAHFEGGDDEHGGCGAADGAGRLPLHVAIEGGAPVAVVRALLAGFPGAAAARDGSSRLPIELAMEQHAPPAVWEEILARHPARALHAALLEGCGAGCVRRICDSDPDAAGELWRSQLPLDTAMSRGAPFEVIAALVDARPESAAGRGLLHARVRQVGERAGAGAELERLLRAHPAGLGEEDAAGLTPLALALALGAPGTVVRMLAAAWPASAGGLNVLHATVAGGADTAALRELLGACPGLAGERASRASQGFAAGDLPITVALRREASAAAALRGLDLSGELQAARAALAAAQEEKKEAEGRRQEALSAAKGALRLLLLAEDDERKFRAHVEQSQQEELATRLWEDARGGVEQARADAEAVEGQVAALDSAAVDASSALAAASEAASAAIARHDGLRASHGAAVEVVELLLEADPACLRAEDAGGELLLHAAVRLGCSRGTVERLLELGGGGAAHQSRRGLLPIDIALDHNHSVHDGVLDVLLRSHPARAAHAALRRRADASEMAAVLRQRYGAAEEQDAWGRLPLDIGLQQGAGAGVLAALLEAHSGGAAGLGLIHRSVARGVSAEDLGALLSAMGAAAEVALNEEDGAGRLPLEAAVEEGASWEVQMALLEQHPGAAARLLSSTGRGIVQRVLGGSGGAQGPPPVDPQADGELLVRLREVLRAYPHGALEADPRTRLRPLHAEVARGAAARVGVVECLLEACPKAAGLADGGGRSPLDVALASGAGAAVLMLLLPGSPAGVGLGPVLTRLVREQRPAGEVEAALGWAGAGAGEGAGAERQVGEALHLAVESRAGVEVVRALLGGSPGAAAHADMRGRLPLHVAAQVGAAPGTVDALLEAYPEGAGAVDGGGKLPSDYGRLRPAPSNSPYLA